MEKGNKKFIRTEINRLIKVIKNTEVKNKAKKG